MVNVITNVQDYIENEQVNVELHDKVGKVEKDNYNYEELIAVEVYDH